MFIAALASYRLVESLVPRFVVKVARPDGLRAFKPSTFLARGCLMCFQPLSLPFHVPILTVEDHFNWSTVAVLP